MFCIRAYERGFPGAQKSGDKIDPDHDIPAALIDVASLDAALIDAASFTQESPAFRNPLVCPNTARAPTERRTYTSLLPLLLR